MKKWVRNRLLAFLRFVRFGKIIRMALDDYNQSVCLKSVSSSDGVLFGSAAAVHNPTRDEGRIFIGKHTHVDGELLVHDYGGKIEIGEYSYIGLGARVWSGESVKIGNHVFLAHNVNISDTNSHQINALERQQHYLRTNVNGQTFLKGSIETKAVIIEDHAWINFGVGILKGVRVGEGAIVGAHSLVTKDVPPYTLVAGNPARVIRELKGQTQ